MEVEGKLLCSYPGRAIQIPADIFMDECFLRELSSFLVQMDVDHLPGDRPGYILQLLVGILRGYGQSAVADRITKRIGDEVLSSDQSWERGGKWREKSLVLLMVLESVLGHLDRFPRSLFEKWAFARSRSLSRHA